MKGPEHAFLPGTTTIGDIRASAAWIDAGGGNRLRRFVFKEILSLQPAQSDEVLRN